MIYLEKTFKDLSPQNDIYSSTAMKRLWNFFMKRETWKVLYKEKTIKGFSVVRIPFKGVL